MPIWLSGILAIGAMLYFDLFWEAVLLFLLSDLLYGVSEGRLFGTTYASFILSVVALLTTQFIKRNTVFYENKRNK
jgi:hypothetical protein